MAIKRRNKLSGRTPLAYMGSADVEASAPLVWISRAPTTNDFRNFLIGTIWINTASALGDKREVYMLVRKDATEGIWIRFFTGATGLETLTGDIGGAVSPDAADNINVLGTATQVITTGNPATNTITLSLDGAVANSYVTDAGTATPVANVLNVLGDHGLNTTGAGNTVTALINNAITLGDLAALGAGVNALSCTTGDINIAAANLKLPRTTTANVGNIKFGGYVYFHNYTNAALGGANNLFVGRTCGNYTLTAASINNVCCGANSLVALTSGNHNTTCGGGVLTHCTVGYYNTGCGNQSLTALVSGNYNSALGTQAGSGTLGSYNTCVGMDSLANLAKTHTGSYNVCVGAGATAGAYVGAESSNILITNPGVAAETNTIHIGTHGAGVRQQNKCYIAGIRGITTTVVDAIPVLISSTHQLGTVSSALRYKENIFEMGSESSPIYKLRPVTFNYKVDETKSKQYGLIAEEVKEHLPRLVVNNDQGEVETVKYHEIPVLLLNELIKQHDTIKNLKDRLRILEEQVSLLLESRS